MTVKKIQYEDCEEVGLQHAWVYLLPVGGGYASGATISGPIHYPVWLKEETIPKLVNTDTIITRRDCENCAKKERLHQIHTEKWEDRGNEE